MKDMIIKGTGNSRYLKSVANILSQYQTYESFAQALAAGTFPIDLNGINSAGVQTAGTPLNKTNLLADSTATGMGLTASATPNEAFNKLNQLIQGRAQATLLSYAGTGESGLDHPTVLTFPFAPFALIYLGYKGSSSSDYWNFPGSGNASIYRVRFFLSPSVLTTKYVKCNGLCNDDYFYIYGKKSADGKTIYFYSEGLKSTTASSDERANNINQLNDSIYTYYILAIG